MATDGGAVVVEVAGGGAVVVEVAGGGAVVVEVAGGGALVTLDDFVAESLGACASALVPATTASAAAKDWMLKVIMKGYRSGMETPRAEDPVRSPNALPLGRRAWVHPDSLTWSFSSSPGPGGQNVNKTATKALLRVDPNLIYGLNPFARQRLELLMQHRSSSGMASFSSHQHRSQPANREECIEHLRAIVKQAEIQPRVRRKTKPSRSSKERRLESKHRDGKKKQDRGWQGGD